MSKPIKEPTAMALILSTGQPPKALLLHHRTANLWMPPGGHQEAWENPLEAVAREVLEETQLEISAFLPTTNRIDDRAQIIPAPVRLVEIKIPAHDDEPEHYHLDQLYIVRIPEQPLTKDDAETHDIGWFTLEEALKLPLPEDVRQLLLREMVS